MLKRKTLPHWTLGLIAVIALALATATAATAQPYAEVGRIHAVGTISFHSWKFRAELSNGLVVHDIYSEISNGFAWVVLTLTDH